MMFCKVPSRCCRRVNDKIGWSGSGKWEFLPKILVIEEITPSSSGLYFGILFPEETETKP